MCMCNLNVVIDAKEHKHLTCLDLFLGENLLGLQLTIIFTLIYCLVNKMSEHFENACHTCLKPKVLSLNNLLLQNNSPKSHNAKK